MKEMKKILLSLICLAVLLNPCPLFAKEKPVRFSDIRPDLESAIGKLSTYINMLEEIQNKFDASARANQNYNEQKNLFLSSQLAITTINAILEYNRDLLVLFGDLKEKNRERFYEVRIESLETSIKQINNMYNQIQINYTILPPDFFEQASVDTECKVIMSSIASLEKCVELLRSVNQK
jgi:hypothetical protein